MKKYVKVTATFDCDGDLIPEYIVWDDGRRYTCHILGKERYLFLEENRWFVDAKQ